MGREPNRLSKEKSPYLLQHAFNPVDWFPWSEEAFAKAKLEDKPVLLSIGYATCHWCHVMERESFEDESTAAMLNEGFIAIKVDREERPDIDKIYMDALYAMNHLGGWPLNMFLTPDKKPIAGGTYFPPKPMYNRKSFCEVLGIIKEAWTNRKEEIIQSSDSLVNFLKAENKSPEEKRLPSIDSFQNARDQFNQFYDEMYFGFKMNMTNKFPSNLGLSFLLYHQKKTGDLFSLEMVENTLRAMKKGGIYDQIGGGISRYSTDHRWIVPHFEKMLYDNSLFLLVMAECYAFTKNNFYKEAIYDIVAYIERDMRLENGGIASAEDADSEGVEGKFYIWSFNELREILGDDFDYLEDLWNVSEDGNFEGNNILNETFNRDFLKDRMISESEFLEIYKRGRNKLFNVRSKRKRPIRDDKVLVSWNCLYIKALAYSARVLEDNELLVYAENTYKFIYSKLFDSDQRLLRRYRDGESKIKAYLTDYAELAHASIYLYEATFDSSYIFKATKLVDSVMKLFSSKDGPFYDTGIDSEELIRRSFDSYDGVEPSGNSTLVNVLLSLSALGINSTENRNHALNVFTFYHNELETKAVSYSSLLTAFYRYSTGIKEVAVVGDKDFSETKKVLKFLQTNYSPDIVFTYCANENIEQTAKIIPLFENRNTDNRLVIYICKDGACELPVYTLEDLKQKLGAFV